MNDELFCRQFLTGCIVLVSTPAVADHLHYTRTPANQDGPSYFFLDGWRKPPALDLQPKAGKIYRFFFFLCVSSPLFKYPCLRDVQIFTLPFSYSSRFFTVSVYIHTGVLLENTHRANTKQKSSVILRPRSGRVVENLILESSMMYTFAIAASLRLTRRGRLVVGGGLCAAPDGIHPATLVRRLYYIT